MTTPNQPRRRKASENELDQRRLVDGVCVRGCGREADVDGGSSMCVPCGATERAANRGRKKRRRDQRMLDGQCTECGAPKPPARRKKRRCKACEKKHAAAKRRGSPPEMVGVPREVYAALSPTRRLPAGVWSVDTHTESDGRTRSRNRFRGHGRRGGPKGYETDEWDLRLMETEISRARAELAAYWSDENQALPRIQRTAPRRSALGHLELMERTLDEIVERTRKALR